MIVRELNPNVYSLAAIDWDWKLFAKLVPLPEGTGYNAYLVNALKAKYGAIIGSYSWGTAMPESLAALLPNLTLEWFPQVISGGVPKAEDFAALDRLAVDIVTANSVEADLA